MTTAAAGAALRRTHRRTALAVTFLATALSLANSTSAGAQGFDENCTSTEIPPVTRPAEPLRFGITPLAAGSAGTSQGEPKPANRRKARSALERLRPRGKQLVLRLNRMFWEDGKPGHQALRGDRRPLRRAPASTASSRSATTRPRARRATCAPGGATCATPSAILGRRESVVALSITNEANFPISPNTSDGSYEGVREAIVRGTTAADRELRRIGRGDIELGFSFAWRWIPDSDREFWEEIGELSTPRFRRALDYVGLQVYPGLVFPPAPRPGVTAGEEVVEALTLLRRCYMPKAGIGRGVDLWVSENGYATNVGRTEAASAKRSARPCGRSIASRDPRHQRLPLLQPARQPHRRAGPLRRGRRPARRLHPQARVRRRSGRRSTASASAGAERRRPDSPASAARQEEGEDRALPASRAAVQRLDRRPAVAAWRLLRDDRHDDPESRTTRIHRVRR